MSARWERLIEAYRTGGFASAARRILDRLRSARNAVGYERFMRGLRGRDPASVFSEIYEKNFWTEGESRSGAGSELGYTANLRKHLPEIFKRFRIRAVVDAPCGDYHWMREVPLAEGMSYVGLDIVPALIARNQSLYGDAQRRFAVADLMRDPLPAGDLLICRDCLFHLSTSDAVLVLKNFVDSGIPYLLTSTHRGDGFRNEDIDTGGFRRIDLFAEPFLLPKDARYRLDDFVPPFPPREMCLWDREQVLSALPGMLESRGPQ